jgi:non-specific serine/threonine protein kinase
VSVSAAAGQPSQTALAYATQTARLLGGAQRLRERAGVGLGPFHDRSTETDEGARRVLGDEYYRRAFVEGALAELDRDEAYQRILARALGQSPTERVVRPEVPRSKEPDEQLTAREPEVAALVAQGWSNPDIARRLVISNRTVQTHVRNILHKRAL